MTRTPLLLLALVACGSSTGPRVQGTEMLSVTCWFECEATQIDYCNVNCGNLAPNCFPVSQPGPRSPARVNLCLSGTTDPSAGIATCMATGGTDLQNAWLATLGIRREWPCGRPDPSSALPAPRWSPETLTVTGLSCRPHPTLMATTSRTVCYSP